MKTPARLIARMCGGLVQSVQESLESQRSTLTAEKERLESALAACQARLGEQQRELDAGETERRQLQSTLQELKVRH